jgi:hypothetical protein
MLVDDERYAPVFLPLGETAGTNFTGGWVGPTASLDGFGKSRPQQGFDPRTVQPVASLYTVYAIPARMGNIKQVNYENVWCNSCIV